MVDTTHSVQTGEPGLRVVGRGDVASMRELLGLLVGRIDVEGVFVGEAPELWGEFDRIGRLADAAKVLLAGRVHESRVWRRAGERDAATWMARASGGSVGAARRALTTCRRLGALPETRRAMACGDLSRDQAEAIADAATVNPDAEQRLVDSASRMSLVELRAECLRAKATGDPDPATTQRRIHAGRFLRTRTDPEGAWCLQARGTAQDGALVSRALEPLITRLLHRACRKEGEPIRREALAFDALVELSRHGLADDGPSSDELARDPVGGEAKPEGSPAMADGDGGREGRVHDVGSRDGSVGESDDGLSGFNRAQRRRRRNLRRFRGATMPNYTALIRADLGALLRGYPADGELCEISGIGPIPVPVARSLLGEAILHLVVTRGRDANVTYLGRGPNAAQRLALLWRNPVCTVEGCPCTLVESDHRRDWRLTRHTRLDELDFLCDFHHDLKTRLGWALVEDHGKRPMVPPDDPRHPGHQRHTTVAA